MSTMQRYMAGFGVFATGDKEKRDEVSRAKIHDALLAQELKEKAVRIEVAQAVVRHTNGNPGSVAWLFGPQYKEARRELMGLATGKKQPLAKCGINALMAELYRLFPVAGECMAERERNLGEAIRNAKP